MAWITFAKEVMRASGDWVNFNVKTLALRRVNEQYCFENTANTRVL
jgi:hypothetical protein